MPLANQIGEWRRQRCGRTEDRLFLQTGNAMHVCRGLSAFLGIVIDDGMPGPALPGPVLVCPICRKSLQMSPQFGGVVLKDGSL
jgi:hypothetical protein